MKGEAGERAKGEKDKKEGKKKDSGRGMIRRRTYPVFQVYFTCVIKSEGAPGPGGNGNRKCSGGFPGGICGWGLGFGGVKAGVTAVGYYPWT